MATEPCSRTREPEAINNIPGTRGCIDLEEPSYRIWYAVDSTIQFDPPTGSRELARALSYHFPMPPNLECKMKAAMLLFWQTERLHVYEQSAMLLANRLMPSLIAKPEAVPRMRESASRPYPAYCQEIVGQEHHIVRRPRVSTSVLDSNMNNDNPPKRKRYETSDDRAKVAAKRGKVCEKHRKQKVTVSDSVDPDDEVLLTFCQCPDHCDMRTGAGTDQNMGSTNDVVELQQSNSANNEWALSQFDGSTMYSFSSTSAERRAYRGPQIVADSAEKLRIYLPDDHDCRNLQSGANQDMQVADHSFGTEQMLSFYEGNAGPQSSFNISSYMASTTLAEKSQPAHANSLELEDGWNLAAGYEIEQFGSRDAASTQQCDDVRHEKYGFKNRRRQDLSRVERSLDKISHRRSAPREYISACGYMPCTSYEIGGRGSGSWRRIRTLSLDSSSAARRRFGGGRNTIERTFKDLRPSRWSLEEGNRHQDYCATHLISTCPSSPHEDSLMESIEGSGA